MSVTAREAIAEAIETVDGLTASTLPPYALHPFLAWPVWTRTTWITSCLAREEYSVYLVLPGSDLPSAIEDADRFVIDVSEALMKVGGLGDITPVQVQGTDAGALYPALRFIVNV